MSESQKAEMAVEQWPAGAKIGAARDVLHGGLEIKKEYGYAALESLVYDLRKARLIIANAVEGRLAWKTEAQRWIDRHDFGG